MSKRQRKFFDEAERLHAPQPDTTLLDPGTLERYWRLKAAIDLSFSGIRSSQIKEECGVSRQELSRYRARFFERGEDGQINGYRALVKWDVRKEYTRRMTSDAAHVASVNGGGFSGCLAQLFVQFPEAQKRLNTLLEGRQLQRGAAVPTAGMNLRAIHARWLGDLRTLNVPQTAWPFCVASAGYSSLARYAKALMEQSQRARLRKYGQGALDAKDAHSGKEGWLKSAFGWDIACYHEQVLPAFGTIVFEHQGQTYEVAADRCSLCVLVSEKTHAILAYHISYRRRVAGSDFMRTFSNFLKPWKPWNFKAVPDFVYRKGAGFPTALPGLLQNIRLGLIKVDGDMTHFANIVLVFLRSLLGVHIQYGQVRRWITRVAVEQVFSELQQKISQLPSTTGSGPQDPRVNDPVGAALGYKVRVDELLELFEVLAANFNGKPRSELMGATPLEALRRVCVNAGEDGAAIPGLRPATLADLPLPVYLIRRVIRGDLATSEPPHIQLDQVIYTNDFLRSSWALIGTPVIGYLYEDHRVVRLSTIGGRNLGVVHATGQWSLSYHDRHTREEILQLRKKNLIAYDKQDDPVQIYTSYLGKKMAQAAAARPKQVRKEANKLMRTQQPGPMPGGDIPASPPPQTPIRPRHSPAPRASLWRAARAQAKGNDEN